MYSEEFALVKTDKQIAFSTINNMDIYADSLTRSVREVSTKTEDTFLKT